MTTSRPTPLPRWLAALALAGLATGVGGLACNLLLYGVQLAVFGRQVFSGYGSLEAVPTARRILGPLILFALGGLAWWYLRAHASRQRTLSMNAGIRGQRMSHFTPLDVATQVSVVGAGLSIGREAAPRQLAVWASQYLERWLRISGRDAVILSAAAAGAGLAAVYNTPLAGVAMAWALLAPREVRSWRLFLSSLPVSALATVVPWVMTGNRPYYLLPHMDLGALNSGQLFGDNVFGPRTAAGALALLCAIAVGLMLLGGAGGELFARFLVFAQHRVHHGPLRARAVLWTVPFAGLAAVALAFVLPKVGSNGAVQVQFMVGAAPAIPLLVAYGLAKPALTWLAVRAGASGGRIAPALATGATLGALVAALLGAEYTALILLVLVTIAAFFAASQRSGVFGGLFVIELLRPPLSVAGAVLLAGLAGYGTARLFFRRR